MGPLSRPLRYRQRKRPPGNLSINGRIHGHSLGTSNAYAKFLRIGIRLPLPLHSEDVAQMVLILSRTAAGQPTSQFKEIFASSLGNFYHPTTRKFLLTKANPEGP
jgi:hypothetical protein